MTMYRQMLCSIVLLSLVSSGPGCIFDRRVIESRESDADVEDPDCSCPTCPDADRSPRWDADEPERDADETTYDADEPWDAPPSWDADEKRDAPSSWDADEPQDAPSSWDADESQDAPSSWDADEPWDAPSSWDADESPRDSDISPHEDGDIHREYDADEEM